MKHILKLSTILTALLLLLGCETTLFDHYADGMPSPEPTPTPTPTPDPNPGIQVEGFAMVFVEGGTFTMGATAEQGSDAESNEKPTHSVTLSDYYIGKYEVTQAQWRAVMGSNPSYFKGDNLPVEWVSWDDIQEFIKKLNAQTGKRFRLPTEAEWEYAARGGNQSKGYKYSGSDSIDEVAWYYDNSSSTTHPVGQKRPNELGIYDMSGNVWEWCQDWYSSSAYSSSSQTNPTGPSSGSGRVFRGGSWCINASYCRVSNRDYGSPDIHNCYEGFRLVLEAEGSESPEPKPDPDPTPDFDTLFGEQSVVYVKGGTFTMGATAEQGSDEWSNEKPTHSVTLSDYYIGKYEVTQAQWVAIMGTNPSTFIGDNKPVDNVSWNDIQEFIQKLNAQTGKRFRLPTEAEWEYAARGGNQSKGYKYSGSNSVADVAWHYDNSSSTTHPVGQKTPNELGIYDMSGNVWEWCQDWYGSYSSEAQTNPTGPSSGSSRMLRGGSWNIGARSCRVSIRYYDYPYYRSSHFGFRLVLETEGSESPEPEPTPDNCKIGDILTINGVKGIVFQTTPSVKMVSVTETTAQWSTEKVVTGATDSDNGRANMTTIQSITDWQSKYPAFAYCADMGEGWYLPALNELKVIYAQKDTINATLSANNMEILGSIDGSLWSSCECSYGSSYCLDFAYGGQVTGDKSSINTVCAIVELDTDGNPIAVPDPATEPVTIPNNEIWYTSTDGNVVNPYTKNAFGASIVSNTYSDGKGIIKFSGDVTTIGDQAFFYYCRNLKSITIPNSVTTIGISAFSDCSGLTSITIPNSITSIGQSAFFDCSSLTSITIPNSVTEIGKSAFTGCSNLREFNGKFASADKRCLIVDSVIHSFAPYGLTNYTIPNSVTEIGDYAFYKCSSLTSITIPNSVTSIREYAFRNCSSLISVSIGNSVTSIESSVFLDCSSLKSITMPNSVISIGICAFKGCSDLTSITIPNSVTSIGYGVFYGCSSLTEFEGKFATTDKRCLIVDGVLISFAPFGLTEYTVQDGVTKIETDAFRDCSNLTRIVIPNTVTRIGGYTFYNCSSLTSITIPNSVTKIGSYAFYSCTSLKSVYCKPTTPPTLGGSYVFDENASGRKIYVPSSSVSAYKSAQYWSEYADAIVADPVTEPATIPNNEIWYTSTDGNIVTPSRTLSSYYGANIISNTYNNGKGIIAFDNTVTQIGTYAFDGCSTLKSITIPNSVTTIGTNVFKHCSNLTSVTLGSSITGISASAFDNCTSLTSIVIPDSVTKIYSSAFSGCTSLTDVTLGTKVSSIGDYAFTNCSNLKNINIPNSVTEICGSAFAGCSSLTNIVISDNVISIGENAFNQCKGLTKITIGNSVKTISSNAFKACSNLTSVTIPSSVTSLGSYVFSGCSSLAAVYCKPTNPPTGGYTMFFGNASGRKIYVPSASVDAYKTANNWSEYADYIVAE